MNQKIPDKPQRDFVIRLEHQLDKCCEIFVFVKYNAPSVSLIENVIDIPAL